MRELNQHINIFILGLGCQKCGTTWLHNYLDQNACFDGGFKKEYHVWDFVDVASQNRKIRNEPLKLKKLFSINHIYDEYRLHGMRSYVNKYFDYFSSLYSEDINVTADITPSYSALSADRIKFIKDQFALRSVEVKPVILIRDPVERAKSAVRMNLKRRNYNNTGIPNGETNFLKALTQYYRSEHCKIRTAYQDIIEVAFDVFGESNVHVGIYENMFTLEEMRRLSQFCGVSLNSEFSKIHINRTEREVGNDCNLDMEIANFYKDVYDYCHQNLPITRQLWNKVNTRTSATI